MLGPCGESKKEETISWAITRESKQTTMRDYNLYGNEWNLLLLLLLLRLLLLFVLFYFSLYKAEGFTGRNPYPIRYICSSLLLLLLFFISIEKYFRILLTISALHISLSMWAIILWNNGCFVCVTSTRCGLAIISTYIIHEPKRTPTITVKHKHYHQIWVYCSHK